MRYVEVMLKVEDRVDATLERDIEGLVQERLVEPTAGLDIAYVRAITPSDLEYSAE